MRSAVLLAAVALTLAACSSAASPSPSASTPPAATATVAASPSASGGTGTTYTVNEVMGAAVGSYLTGEDGMTLYVKQGDTTSATNCTGQCVTAWPPFTVEAGEQAVAGSGVTGTLATFQRPEGSTQVTYNGKPLYYFSKDTKAGDTNGQGVAGVWSVAAP